MTYPSKVFCIPYQTNQRPSHTSGTAFGLVEAIITYEVVIPVSR